MPEPFRASVRIQRNSDGSLPHVGLGGSARSMRTHDQAVGDAEALTVQFHRLIAEAHEQGHVGREPIRVQAEVGRPVPEVEAT